MIEDFSDKYKLPSYRVKQFDKQYYQNSIEDFNEITDWPKDLREKLKEELKFSSILPEKVFGEIEEDTMKVAFNRINYKKLFESVLLRHKDGRNTVCVSCMIGCPVGCTFCATGKMGFIANLKTNEIVDQILFFQRKLKKINQKVTNIVFMGMGEPLLNWQEVKNVILLITNPDKFAMSIKRVTISTCGIIKGIKELTEFGFKGRLAISLHAPSQSLRETLIPISKVNKLDDLMQVLDEYVVITNQRISYEYILLNGINDSTKEAEELVNLLSGRLAHVNLIRYNKIEKSDYEKSSQKNLHNFCSILDRNKINYTIRVSLGSNIKGACGQLTTNIY